MMALVGPIVQAGGIVSTIVSVIDSFVRSVVESFPSMLAAITFLVVAFVGISIVRAITRRAVGATLPADEELVVDLTVLVVSIFLWFGALLVTLDILGMGEIAASLGTATGFVALGISYALSHVVADTVAGVYLLRDPDFEVGDRVTTASVTGTVTGIGLRKTRLETAEGETVVLANAEVDKRWHRLPASTTDESSE